jgi:hypothetical protein
MKRHLVLALAAAFLFSAFLPEAFAKQGIMGRVVSVRPGTRPRPKPSGAPAPATAYLMGMAAVSVAGFASRRRSKKTNDEGP